MKLRLLRTVLGFSGLVWSASVFGVSMNWSTAEASLQGLGAQPIAYDKMLDYWLRMAAGAFTLIGCWYLVLAIWPRKFQVAIPWFGALMLLEGIILLVRGLRLGLPPLPFYADSGACLLLGGEIMGFSRDAFADAVRED
jgi:hypothetical protein